MKKIFIILIAVFIAASCNQATKKQAETTTEVIAEQKSNVIEKLRKKYLHFFENNGFISDNEEYYKNLNCIGLGVANPKDFHFQLITDTTNMQKIEIKDIEAQELLIPLFWKPDYMIFYMTVVGISENWYEVRANTEMTVWVNKSEFDFYTWENLLKDKTTCIVTNIAYREKDIHSESIEIKDNGDYTLVVEKVEGDWVYVKAAQPESEILNFRKFF